jgi:SAM-dependent methyltransferase
MYMPQAEGPWWQNVGTKYLVSEDAKVCLDYGTGNGLVPQIMGKFLKKEDSLICCDISSEMLKICENNLKIMPLLCKTVFLKIEGDTIPLSEGSVDIITANSVLHHVFDLGAFAAECKRILKPGGILAIAHEPNKNSKLPFAGKLVQLMATLLFRPKSVCFRLIEKLPLFEEPVRRVLGKVSKAYRERNKMLSDIAQQLKKDNLVDFELRGTEVQQIVDFHSQYGFDIRDLLGGTFKKFELLESETYNHLGFLSYSKVARSIDQYLTGNWPHAGKQLRFLLRNKR